MQFYTDVAEPVGAPHTQVVVAQATLPKRYHDILVRRRGAGRFQTDARPSRDLVEHRLESAEFNERWRVFAHPEDDLAAFELLHPAFLERLAATPESIGIEAVGNFLFVFDDGGHASYELLLELLDEAFDQLQL